MGFDQRYVRKKLTHNVSYFSEQEQTATVCQGETT